MFTIKRECAFEKNRLTLLNNMTDFSKFTGPSAEWLALESTLPPQPALSIEELQKVTNGVREKAATQAMVSEGVYI